MNRGVDCSRVSRNQAETLVYSLVCIHLTEAAMAETRCSEGLGGSQYGERYQTFLETDL